MKTLTYEEKIINNQIVEVHLDLYTENGALVERFNFPTQPDAANHFEQDIQKFLTDRNYPILTEEEVQQFRDLIASHIATE